MLETHALCFDEFDLFELEEAGLAVQIAGSAPLCYLRGCRVVNLPEEASEPFGSERSGTWYLLRDPVD